MAKCGAKTRSGTPCKQSAMDNGRCRLHGGKSTGAPKGNSNAVKHGFFQKVFPDDPETMAIIASIDLKSPIEILWENIVIQYTAIVRAQKLMFVRDQEDETRVKTREKFDLNGDVSEEEWEIQHAWDKHASFLQAQSRAISTLESLLARYEDMLPDSLKMQEQRLKLEKLKADIERVKNPEGNEVDEWTSAVEEVAERRSKLREQQNHE